ncbi:tetratricopeptide repeat protein [Flavobacterium sp. CBA20B-1]|uniref:tetratricopeptide repeat protein n=1 Tax=unclassified Flavobacterium TaxID=196869 RepID=UPI002224085A|nr:MULTISPECIES: tetratricopeptide repeat protein [unclassified Flavobacterium]WCM43404.1 tetratricopeptide repeat protein [Flavobacterium sp. CBA20B-1]
MKYNYILLLALIFLGCKKSISEADKKLAVELNNKAIDYRMNNDLEKAKEHLAKALEIDPTDFSVRHQLIGIYTEQDSLNKAFEILDKIPSEQKNTMNFYQTKGNLYDYSKQTNKAIENYKKALALTKLPANINNELELNDLVNYAMLETLSGKKEQAVNRLNKALKLDWLTENNREHLEFFRNEFEFYQGSGAGEFESEDEVYIKTTNTDSLISILKKYHVNVSGSISISGSSLKMIQQNYLFLKNI